MAKPPLLLERSFFTKIEIEADPAHKRGPLKLEVRADQNLADISLDGSRWQLGLDVVVGVKDGTPPPPYRVHLQAVGFFTFPDPNRLEAEKARMLAVTGASILYSQAREYLLILTSRGPWGPFQLPTVSFVDVSPTKEELPAAVLREPERRYRASPARTKPRKAPADQPRKRPAAGRS